MARVDEAVEVLPGGLDGPRVHDEAPADGLSQEVLDRGVGALRGELQEMDGEVAGAALALLVGRNRENDVDDLVARP
eukprot:406354-Alexandrium_andersonii.AAC.1